MEKLRYVKVRCKITPSTFLSEDRDPTHAAAVVENLRAMLEEGMEEHGGS
jgi:class 3 adenylate cyclase